MTMVRMWRWGVAVSMALTAGVSACGDDGEKSGDTTVTDTTTDATGDTATDADDTGTAPDGIDTADGTTPGDTSDATAEQAAVLAVPEVERWKIPGLSGPVQVIRTEGNIPHIYAANELDLARVLGFVQARDRFFFMDVQRRLGEGRLSELLGDLALGNDVESRNTALPYLTDRLVAHMSPAFQAYLEAFVAGVNFYIDEVRAERVTPPSETSFSALLGYDSPADMLKPFTVRDMMALVAVVMWSTNFGTDDVGQTANALRLDGLFDGVLDGELRKSGFMQDIYDDVRPMYPGTNSADGFGLTGRGATHAGGALSTGTRRGKPAKAPVEMIERLYDKLRARELQLGKDREAGFGSNAWAVMGEKTKDGKTLFANDGHLELTIPPLAYGAHLDTVVFGGGDLHLHGGWLGNFPVHIGGSNGDVAFGGVNPVLDITDWYSEQIQLGEDGRPAASKFGDEWKPLTAVDEQYVIANVAALQSVGRTDTWTRWTTFDGRWLTSIEGRILGEDEEPAVGEVVVNMMGDRIVPGDLNHDGVVTGVTFDYVALDATRWPEALRQLGFAKDVDEIREATKGYVGAALYTAGADRHGNILYTSYQAIPCRGYLGEQGGTTVRVGTDPTMLLDGTKYGGFEIPSGADGKVDENPGKTDPYKCVVPWERMPHTIDPVSGFIFTANNDPGGLTDDGDHLNDEYYLGGPWDSVRANSIRRGLQALTTANQADAEAMANLQADKTSRIGEAFGPPLVAALKNVKALSQDDGPKTADEQRRIDIYTANAARFDETATRIQAWLDAGAWAASGVETFYEEPTAQDLEDSVATMIFNAWSGRFIRSVWDDEGISSWRYSGARESITAIVKFLAGRGPNNPGQLASWNEATGEAVFFDKLGTPEVERADELMLQTLAEALDFLSGPTPEPGKGGFATADMSKWLWGLKHQARFESVLLTFAGSIDAVKLLFADYSITTARVPLADSIPAGDPRKGLEWFPRGGDQWGIDAANPGFSGTDFTYGSGPAMRLVYALDNGKVTGKFILPGGESGVISSPHYDDQVRLWLANHAYPIRFSVEDVAAGATGREVYEPAPSR